MDETDVLNEWAARGYITEEQRGDPRYFSHIREAKAAILGYCNIPPGAKLPAGLFYPWVQIAWRLFRGTVTIEGSGEIKSVTEGDTKIEFDVGAAAQSAGSTAVDYTSVLRRYRRMP